jgi:hypothetical protein
MVKKVGALMENIVLLKSMEMVIEEMMEIHDENKLNDVDLNV